jgi:hypothetical protein
MESDEIGTGIFKLGDSLDPTITYARPPTRELVSNANCHPNLQFRQSGLLSVIFVRPTRPRRGRHVRFAPVAIEIRRRSKRRGHCDHRRVIT